MDMKIDRLQPTSVVSRYEASSRSQKASGIKTQGKDKLELSGNAISFASVLKDAFSAIETRTASESSRLQSVAQQVKDGTYKVDSQKVADKMLEGFLFDAEI